MKIVNIIIMLLILPACGGGSSESPEPHPLQAEDLDQDGVEDSADCDPRDKTKFQWIPYFAVDEDGDTYFHPLESRLCTGDNLPSRYKASPLGAEATVDCDDQDRTKYKQLFYTFEDKDQDGFAIEVEQTSFCGGESLPLGFYTEIDPEKAGDCDDESSTIFRHVFLFDDLDQDGIGKGKGQITCIGESIPTQKSTVGSDCDDQDTLKYQLLDYTYIDEDKDQHFVAASGRICSGSILPEGFSTSLEGNLDCDDSQPVAFQVLPYSYEDKDQDGYAVRKSGQACSGNSLQAPYFDSFDPAKTNDCDDSLETGSLIFRYVNLYKDSDRDSYGVGQVSQVCIGHQLPDQTSDRDGDCNDNDKTKYNILSWSFVDEDLDSYPVPQSGSACLGDKLPTNHYRTMPTGKTIDCDDRNQLAFREHSYTYIDADLDTYPVQKSDVGCFGQILPSNYYKSLPDGQSIDCDDSDRDKFQVRTFLFRDKDDDGYAVIESGAVCTDQALPATYYMEFDEAKTNDCDDELATGSDVFRLSNVYADIDRDGHGRGPAIEMCIGDNLPNMTSFTADDCDDGNKAIYKTLTWNYVDGDGDGYPILNSGSGCLGDTLPENYFFNMPAGKSLDCNDSDKGAYLSLNYNFRDKDGDSYPVKNLGQFGCFGDTLPKGYYVTNPQVDKLDCDDNELTGVSSYQHLLYSFRDKDQDGFVVADAGKVCTGESLPKGYFTERGNLELDCDDSLETGSSLHTLIQLYTDRDGDGLGTGNQSPYCTSGIPPKNTSLYNSDCDDSDSNKLRNLSYQFWDLDGDGYPSRKDGEICSGETLPEGYFAEVPVGKTVDCDDTIATGSNRWQLVVLYPDEDQDSYGVGEGIETCIGSFDGVSTGLAFSSSDCNDSDENQFHLLDYHYTDQDSDGFFVRQSGQVCASHSLPRKYRLRYDSSIDCNDDPSTGSSIWSNIATWYVDADQDGYFSLTVDTTERCVGLESQDPTHLSRHRPHRPDCNDDPETGSAVYRRLALFTDSDGDGYGVSDSIQKQCIGKEIPSNFSRYGNDIDDNDSSLFEIEETAEEELLIIKS